MAENTKMLDSADKFSYNYSSESMRRARKLQIGIKRIIEAVI